MLIGIKIKKAIKNPKRAIIYLVGGKKAKEKRIFEIMNDFSEDNKILEKLEKFLQMPLKQYHLELIDNELYTSLLMKMARNWNRLGAFGITESRMLYVICRALKPEIVIETGVASGLSSSMFLLAMNKTGIGHLYSIDLPPSEELNEKIEQATLLPKEKSSGWLIPENLKNRWTLTLGDSKKILPELLNDVKKCDLFLHDSDHSYEYMSWEFKTVSLYLKTALLSDDISKNNAFDEFASNHTGKKLKLSNRMGFFIL